MYFILVISEFKSYMTKNLRNDFFKISEVSKNKFRHSGPSKSIIRTNFGRSICEKVCKHINNDNSYLCKC